MLGTLDYSLWTFGFLLELSVVVCLVYRHALRRYYAIAMYMIAQVVAECLHYTSILRSGVDSREYYYIYYYTESLLTVLLFFVIIQFYEQVFAELNVSRYIRGGALFLLVATAMFAYLVVSKNEARLTSAFVIELGQDLYFVGVVLTYLLWVAILKLRQTRTRLIQLVLALGIYFSATAGVYALRNLFPVLGTGIFRFIVPAMGTLLPLAWAFAFLKVPEEARLATARLLTPQHFGASAR